MIEPHGGRLVKRVADERLREEAGELEKVEIDRERALDVENIGLGIYSPLDGFMCSEDFESVLWERRLSNGLSWTIPIVLDLNLQEGESYALTHRGTIVGIMEVEEVYRFDRREYARCVFGTEDTEHPGVRRTMEMGEVLAGGRVWFVEFADKRFDDHFFPPEVTREIFRKWDYVVAFQTRNAPHVGHEYVQKSAMMAVEAYTGGSVGLFINPVIGRKKKGDFRDEAIIKAYQVLIENYYRRENTFLGIWKTEMRYAGPREAVLHAIVRQNFGATHFIVGRDHAGVGNFYGPYDAHEMLKEHDDLKIKPLFFKEFHFCERCGVISKSLCPHDAREFSGTYVRKCLLEGIECVFIRDEVLEAIAEMENPFVGEEGF
ncbi:sulfate adenylyltransferase [Geoglobus ahangari]|uniref:sulfate adenylyltransferase n=1 Tax=Geoglobus ahangari TaxID=113653 RepID=A0A0F7IBU1_9EURY|nr:sulfate adenylyltransferase [Geoglobus ahangari]AKG90664.1 sulfate adenylyltransferase [Geoglobus ahangari]